MNPEYMYDIEQGSEDWLKLRRGIVTASVAKNLLTSTFKIADNQTVRTLANVLAAERITGRMMLHYETFDMARGHVEEEIAREVYEKNYAPVRECGFIFNVFGFSPDGLVGEDGFIEIKSRQAKFQVETILADKVPEEYMAQIQMGFIVSGRKWCDFIQYSNGMPLFVKRVLPDSFIIEKLTEALDLFEQRVQHMVVQYAIKCVDNNYVKTEWIDHVEFSDDITGSN